MVKQKGNKFKSDKSSSLTSQADNAANKTADDASKSDGGLHHETMRMIQELGIPDAAAQLEATETGGGGNDEGGDGGPKGKAKKKKKSGSKAQKASSKESKAGEESNAGKGDGNAGDVRKRVDGESKGAAERGGRAEGVGRAGGRGGRGGGRGGSDGERHRNERREGRGQQERGREHKDTRKRDPGGGRGERGRGRGGPGRGRGGRWQGRDSPESDDLGAFSGMHLKHPVVNSGVRWYEAVPKSLNVDGTGQARGGKEDAEKQILSKEGTAHAEAAAKVLFQAEASGWASQKSKQSTSDDRWVEQVLRGGTLSDKVAALTLQVQESPVHRLEVLDKLLDLGLKKERRTAQMALEALKDLFINNLLPGQRRLVQFESRPLQQAVRVMGIGREASSVKRVGSALIMWYFEDQVRKRFIRIIEAIEAGSGDSVENFKRFSLEAAKEMLEAKPEGEARLLALLVNKLGDPNRKICSKVIHLLQLLLRKHPAMTNVVVREVQQYLHRPGLQPRALYAGVIFLNQVYLSRDDGALASSLVQTYLKLFEVVTTLSSTEEGTKSKSKKRPKSKSQKAAAAPSLYVAGSRLLSALLTGVNRARPFLPPGDPGVRGKTMSLLRVVHTESFSTATQALSLLFQVASDARGGDAAVEVGGTQAPPEGEGADGDGDAESLRSRIYSALYAKLLSPDFAGASNPVLFLNLLYKAMKTDDDEARVTAFAKRVLQVTTLCESPLAAAGLFVVSEALKNHRNLSVVDGGRGEVLPFSVSWVPRNAVVMRSFLAVARGDRRGLDEEDRTVVGKRTEEATRVGTQVSPPYIHCGLDYSRQRLEGCPQLMKTPWVSHLEAIVSKLSPLVMGRRHKLLQISDGEVDGLGRSRGRQKRGRGENHVVPDGGAYGGRRDSGGDADKGSAAPENGLCIPGYNPEKRDPRYAVQGNVGANANSLWEACLLRSHVHPSVSRFADGMLCSSKHAIDYSGDPLADFALMPFLDRFAYRNPKARTENERSAGTMRRPKPLGGALRANAPVNDESFVARPAESISVDQVFFHRFFREKATRDNVRGKKKAKGRGEDEDEEDFDVDIGSDGRAVLEQDDDPEEEAFAMDLAEKLLEDDKANMDDEDPDMDDWGDMGYKSDGSESADGEKKSKMRRAGGDADDFMDDDPDSDEEGLLGGDLDAEDDIDDDDDDDIDDDDDDDDEDDANVEVDGGDKEGAGEEAAEDDGDGEEEEDGAESSEELQGAKALRDVAEGFSTDEDEDQEGEEASNANQGDRDGRAKVANGGKAKSRRVSWLAEGKMDYYEAQDDADADGDEELEMEEYEDYGEEEDQQGGWGGDEDEGEAGEAEEEEEKGEKEEEEEEEGAVDEKSWGDAVEKRGNTSELESATESGKKQIGKKSKAKSPSAKSKSSDGKSSGNSKNKADRTLASDRGGDAGLGADEEDDGMDDIEPFIMESIDSEKKASGRKKKADRPSFVSFDDYEKVLEAWDPDNPEAELPSELLPPGSKWNAGRSGRKSVGRGRRSGTGDDIEREEGVGDDPGGNRGVGEGTGDRKREKEKAKKPGYEERSSKKRRRVSNKF